MNSFNIIKLILIFVSALLLGSCSNSVNDDYYMKQIDVFAYSAELKLTDKGTFVESEIDAHARLGGISKGTFNWEGNVLTLIYSNKKTYYIKIDSSLYRIEEYDSLLKHNKIIDSNDTIIPLSIKYASIPFKRPSRTNFKLWESGRIENFSDMLDKYRKEQDVLFEEK